MRRVLIAVAAVLALASPAAAATVPQGFVDDLYVALEQPTALAFLPGGQVLVTTQRGNLSRVRDGVPTTAIDLTTRICSDSERGLLGVAVDPQFAQNGFVYLYYTFNRSNSCSRGDDRVPVNRVSRFTMSSVGVVDPATEVVLVDNVPSVNGNHNGGDLQFGKDGNLYVSIGDSAVSSTAPDRSTLRGKILRITRDGGVPADNPFPNGPRCARAGGAAAGQICAEIFAYGLRNPFRMAFDPDASVTSFYINDVGQNAWEEVDRGVSGADYGWPSREGKCANGSTTNCPAPPAGVTDPLFAYGRGGGCGSISGGAFVPNGVWPGMDNVYLYADYVCGRIFALSPTFQSTAFASNAGGVVHLAFGPSGTSQALFYTTFQNGGEVRRISRRIGPAGPVQAQRCTVPKLTKLTVVAARAALVGNGCALGKVKRVFSAKVRRGLIVSQTAKIGTKLKRGAKVGVSVSRGPRR